MDREITVRINRCVAGFMNFRPECPDARVDRVCTDCDPSAGSSYSISFHCKKIDRSLPDNADREIPDWCPLPEAKDQAHMLLPAGGDNEDR